MQRLFYLAALALLGSTAGCGTGSDGSRPATNGVAAIPTPTAADGSDRHALTVDFASGADDVAPFAARTFEHLESARAGTRNPISLDREIRDDRPMAHKESAWEPPKQAPTTPQRPAGIQAGTLTAGSIDDHAAFDDFRDYLNNVLQRGSPNFPSLSIGQRVIIRVQNGRGEGIGDAAVTLHALDTNGQRRRTVLATTTGSDGRALFLSEQDASGLGREFELLVTLPDRGETVAQRVSLDRTPWTVTLAEQHRNLPLRLDLALVVDTTGSMADELEYLKVEIDDIAASVQRLFPNVDQRYALILYRDEGDDYVTRTADFTGSLVDFRAKLSQQSASGGGDYPEAMHLALEQASQLAWRSDRTARVMFLVGDAPPHVGDTPRAFEAVEQLRGKAVTVFPVAASGVKEQAEFILRSTAFLTMGQYLFLTDHSGVGNPHAKPQSPAYAVERLNQLMVRMIAGELAGRSFMPHEVIAIEGNAANLPPEQPPASAAPQPAIHHAASVTPSFWSSMNLLLRWIGVLAAVVLLLVVDKHWAV